MVVENMYLRKAVEKAGCVVLVKTCNVKERNSRLDYISPNAGMLGMNVELLYKGMKLSEDYIYPEDRAKVMTTLVNAVADGVEDYVHEYRMVGDDGQLHYVSNEICLSDKKGDTITIEVYMRKTSEGFEGKGREEKYQTGADRERKQPDVADDMDTELASDDIRTLMQAFADTAGLYSVYVNYEGKVIFAPTGPAANLGDFYDLFEKPAYKEYYRQIKQVMLEKNRPTVLEREEGGDGRISAAPVYMQDEVKGFWILGSYTEEETKQLEEVCRNQWAVAKVISKYLYNSKMIEVESAKARGANAKLEQELARQHIANAALNKINSKLINSADQVVRETVQDVGLHLDVDKIFIYTYGMEREGTYSMRHYWDVSGGAPDEELLVTLPDRMYIVHDGIKAGGGRYMVDRANMTETSKLNLMRYNFKAVIVYPLYLNTKFYGMLFFADCKTGRVWTKEELRFTQSISLLIQNIIENAEGDDNIRKVNKHLIETYNSFKVGIFIRDAQNGEVLFSNTTMNEMLGYDFTGRDSRDILTNLHDRFDNITGMRKPFITKDKIVNWRSYIQRLDHIMDITEIQMEWLKGERASMIIMRKVKE